MCRYSRGKGGRFEHEEDLPSAEPLAVIFVEHVRDDGAQHVVRGKCALEQSGALRRHLRAVGPEFAFKALAEHLQVKLQVRTGP